MNRVGDLGRHYLRERPGRAALVTFSVALGVAVVVAIGAGTATLDRGVDRLGGAVGAADVVVSSAGPHGSRLAPSVVSDLESQDGVVSVAAVTADTQVISRPGDSRDAALATLLAVPLDRVQLLVDQTTSGRLPTAPDEIAVSTRVTERLRGGVGADATIGGSTYRIVGVLAPGMDDVTGDNRVVVGGPQLVPPADPSLVLLKLAGGVKSAHWIATHQSAFPAAAMDDASMLRSSLRDLFSVINVGFGSMSLLTIGLAAFLIYLALAAAVAQRTHDYGVLFALGASRRQVMVTVVSEALLVGIAGSVAGIALGILGARAFSAAVAGLFNLPREALVIPPSSIVVGALLGVGASVIAAVGPARRAARTAPIAAIRDVVPPVAGRRWRMPVGVTLLVLGLLMTIVLRDATFNPGTPATLIGLPLLMADLVPWFARAVRPILRRMAPGVGDLALANLEEERHRLSLTAGLVTAALTIVVLTGAGYQSIAPQMRRYMELQFGSDVQVYATARLGIATLPLGFDDQVRAVPGVRAVTPLWFSETRIAGNDRQRALTVIDPTSYFDAAGYSFVDGSQRAAIDGLTAGGSVLVNQGVSQQQNWHVGDTVALMVGGRRIEFTIAATYAAFGDERSRAFVIGTHDGTALLGLGAPNELRIDGAPGSDPRSIASHIPLPTAPVEIRFGDDNVEQAMRQFNGVFGMFLVIMAMAGVVGLLGVANTMAISVLQRRRQIGVLRAVGTRRGEIRNMVLGEALLLVLVALLVAVPIAAVMAASSSSASATVFGFKPSSHFPWTWLPPIMLITVVAGLLAGLAPARRATRLDPIAALRTE